MFYYIFSKLNKIKIFPYYIITPCIYAIGTASDTLIEAFNKNNKKILIIKNSILQNLLNYSVCNHALFDTVYVKKHKLNFLDKIIKNFIRFFIEIEFFFRRSFVLIIKKLFNKKLSDEMGFPMIGISEINSYKKINYSNFHNFKFNKIKKNNYSNKLNLEIENEKKLETKVINKIFKSKRKIKFVCIHIRDSLYHLDAHKRIYRNSNINNYKKLIQFLISKGIYVVRLGSPASEKINFKNKKFIDYSRSEYREPIIDLYLIKNCDFVICTHSGIFDTARLFNKPILITNMTNIFNSYPQSIQVRGIFKNLIYKKKKISIKKYISLPFYNYLSDLPNFDNLKFIENTSLQLFRATKEFYSLFQNKKYNLNKKQKNFNKLLKKRLKTIFDIEIKEKNQFKSNLSKRQNLRMIKFFKSCEGCFANSFLKEKKNVSG